MTTLKDIREAIEYFNTARKHLEYKDGMHVIEVFAHLSSIEKSLRFAEAHLVDREEVVRGCPFCDAHVVSTSSGWVAHHKSGCFLSLLHGSTYFNSGRKAWNTRSHDHILGE